ncbi:uri1, prefoldin-like chaperone [Geranomyces variabilis]|uniref:Uri1, prefoldin-like chaperone n=1 Tax=Geranomyces variabilis TaxID=109894 RepID=A0AAD5XN44_9FUNG|nr:uri1, prefoldin-like chaperone [Geranomyces variabilis]
MSSSTAQSNNEAETSAEMLERYREKLKQMISTTEANLQHWKKYDADYLKLANFMQDAVKTTTKPVKVPFGPFAFVPGHLVHTNEVTVLLGDNWFAERSVAEAVDMVGRRREYTAQQMRQQEETLKDLNARAKAAGLGLSGDLSDLQLESSMVDEDGDEVNEEGLKFVDIREDYDESGVNAKPAAPSKPSAKDVSPPAVPAAKLGEFEQKLFAKIAELEERELLGDEADSDDEDSEEEEEEDLEADSDGEMRFETMDDDDDDYNDFPVNSALRLKSSRKPKAHSKQVRFSDKHLGPTSSTSLSTAGNSSTTASDIYQEMSVHPATPTLRPAAPLIQEINSKDQQPKALAAPHRPSHAHNPSLSDVVVEHSDVESVDDSETDDFMFGRELQSEYHQRRTLMLQADTIVPKTPEEEYMAQEEVNQQRDENMSRFRAARLASRTAIAQHVELLPRPKLYSSSLQTNTVKSAPPPATISESSAHRPEVPKKSLKAVPTGSPGPRVSRFKAERMAAAPSSSFATEASSSFAPELPDEDAEEERHAVRVVRTRAPPVVRRAAPKAPPVVGSAAQVLPPAAAVTPRPQAPDIGSNQQAPVHVSEVQQSAPPKKMSRFKAQRLGLE